MFHRNNQGASISQKSTRGLLVSGGGISHHPKYWGLFPPQQPFWGFNVRPQWQDIPHTLSGICNISIRWLSHRTVGTGKSVQVLGLSPKRTGLGVPHGSSSIAAGAPQGPARAAASGQAARSPGCAVLDLPQLPAGAAQWPPGVAQGARQLPCGGLCSHGPSC